MYVSTFSKAFRARWVSAHVRLPSNVTGASNLPVIPGIHVAVNRKKRFIRAVDPLGFPANRDLLDELSTWMQSTFGHGTKPQNDVVLKRASDTDIKTCLWELANFVWQRKAVIVQGTLPGDDEQEKAEFLSKTPGELRVRHFFLRGGADGVPMESPYATEEELKRLAEPQSDGVVTMAPGASGEL